MTLLDLGKKCVHNFLIKRPDIFRTLALLVIINGDFNSIGHSK